MHQLVTGHGFFYATLATNEAWIIEDEAADLHMLPTFNDVEQLYCF